MRVPLPPGNYVLSPEDYHNVRRVMHRLADGSNLDFNGRKTLARVLDDATRNAPRVRDLSESVRDLKPE